MREDRGALFDSVGVIARQRECTDETHFEQLMMVNTHTKNFFSRLEKDNNEEREREESERE